jgi:hypothetical protein
MPGKARSRTAPPRRPSANVIATVAVVVLAVVVVGGVLLLNRSDDTGSAEAAAVQGKYREMYHQLYDTHEQWALASGGQQVSDDAARAATLFDSYATAIGLDLDRFHTDAASAAVTRRIDTGVAAGAKAGVPGTPTLFVDGEKFEPRAETFADVDREPRDLLDKALGR